MIGILLVNLGTPDSPQPKDVKKYLIEFLTDGRVIDYRWLTRQLLVRGLIVPKRYKNSAQSYAAIWTEEGSPLLIHGRAAQKALQQELGDGYFVELAMRYQNPSIEQGLLALQARGVSRYLILPLFPQYASASTGSVQEKVMDVIRKWLEIPSLAWISDFPTHPKMVAAFADLARRYPLDTYDHVLFSFHGLPERHVLKANRTGHCLQKSDCCATLSCANRQCYSAQCFATARAIADTLHLPAQKWSLSFQSRLGRDPWLRPYTAEVLKQRCHAGDKKILVFCPSFVCDCLETLYEIGVEYKAEFLQEGGERLDLVEGLNVHPLWIEALKELVHSHVGR